MLHLILYIVALVCFLLAAFGVPSKVNFGWLGLAAFMLTFII